MSDDEVKYREFAWKSHSIQLELHSKEKTIKNALRGIKVATKYLEGERAYRDILATPDERQWRMCEWQAWVDWVREEYGTDFVPGLLKRVTTLWARVGHD